MSQMKKVDLDIVKSLPGNDKCAECSMKHPQWASVSFGTLFCLECSGIHRSLGVHISFVRSIAMDSWNESQLVIMKTGGNDKCNSYLKANGIHPVQYTTHEAVNGGIKSKYDNDVALLYKLKIKARAQGTPEPTQVPQKKVANSSASASASASTDRNGMERLRGETDSQYIARQTKLREEAKARMAAKFGGGGGGMNGKRVMGGVGSSPHPSQQSTLGGFNFDSLSTGLASVTSTAATGFGSAWAIAKDTVGQTTEGMNSRGATSNVGATASDFGSSLWTSISSVTKEIGAVVQTEDGNAFSDLNQRMKTQQQGSGRNAQYSGFGSQDLMAKAKVPVSTSATAASSDADASGIAPLPNETDQQYMQRQLRIQEEAKARMAAKFGNNPGQAMNKMSVGTTKSSTKPVSKAPASDDFFASFGT